MEEANFADQRAHPFRPLAWPRSAMLGPAQLAFGHRAQVPPADRRIPFGAPWTRMAQPYPG
eukprot:5843512-Alexandrium_andersonii.AAC.1